MYALLKLKVVTLASALSIAAGISVIIGWVFKIPLLATVFPNYASMKFNTAMCFVMLGTTIMFTQISAKDYKGYIFLIQPLIVIIICTLSLSQDIFNINLRIDQLLVADTLSTALHHPFPGRMASNTALCFILFGSALMGLMAKNRTLLTLSQYLLHSVTVISALSILGYLYSLSMFYNSYFATSMAIHTAVLLFLLSIITSLLRPTLGITALFTGSLVGNMMARRVFLFIVCFVIVLGAVRIGIRSRGLFSAQTDLSLLVICFIGLGLGLIWHTANWLNKFDLKRSDAEEEIKVMNEMLEKRVEERSAKLLNLLKKLKESESKFRAAFEHSAMGMALVSLKGKLLKVNRQLCDMVGYREQELLTMSFNDLNYPGETGADLTAIDKALKNKNAAYKVEKRYLCKNGSTAWVSINVAMVTQKKGGPVYFVSQFEDITERKRAELQLKSAYKKIKDHINSITEIAWKQSHLIRSPLANLKGLVELLREDPADKVTLNYIKTEMERLDAVIIEMAEDACQNGITDIVVKKRALSLVTETSYQRVQMK